MGFWVVFFTYLGTFLLSELLRPKPNIENARPAGEDEFDFPTATEGRHVPIIIGKVQIGGPNVIWYGDIEAAPITEEIKTGLFSSDDVTVGFEYFAAIQMALCRGPIGQVHRIWHGEKVIFDQTQSPVVGSILDSPETQFRVDEPTLFGGSDRAGGMNGTFEFFYGVTDGPTSTFLASRTTPLPTYQNTCYCIFRDGTPVEAGGGTKAGGYIGNSPNVRPFKFEVSRYPNNLGSGNHIIGDDANAIEFLFELLTDDDWGLGIQAAEINTTGTLEEGGFVAVANQVAAEGLGFSAVFERPVTAREIIAEIERHVDGFFRVNVQTGQFEIVLARPNTASPDPAVAVDETNIIELKNFSRGSWSETENELRLTFPDRSKNYAESHALAQDMANRLVQGRSPAQLRYPGIKTASVANLVVWREMRSFAFPLAKIQFEANRTLYLLQPGDTVLWSWTDLGIVNLRMRIIKVGYGSATDEKLIIDAVEDVYNLETAAFVDPPASGWTPPPVEAVALAADEQRLVQIPVALQDTGRTGSTQQVMTLAKSPGGLHVGYEVRQGPHTSEDSTLYTLTNVVREFTPTALLRQAVARFGSTDGDFGGSPDTEVWRIHDTTQIDKITAHTFSELSNNLVNLALIDDEYIFFEDAVLESGGSPTGDTYVLTGVRRGMLNSVPKDHAANARIWFFTYGAGLTHSDPQISGITFGGQLSYKFITLTVTDTLNFASATRMDANITASADLDSSSLVINAGYPPNDLVLNDRDFREYGTAPSPENITCGTLTFRWMGRDSTRQLLTGQGGLGVDTDQNDGHIDPQVGHQVQIEILRTDRSPEERVYFNGAIPTVGDVISPEGGLYIITPDKYFLPTASPLKSPETQLQKEYRVKVASQVGTSGDGSTSQEWDEIIQVTGYGLDYGENYGGICDPGVNLAQGDPPQSNSPIPGFENFRQWRFTIAGAHGGSLEDHTYYISAFNNLTFAPAWDPSLASSGDSSIIIDGSSLTTIAQVRDHIANELATALDNIFSVAIDGNDVVVSTNFGTLFAQLNYGIPPAAFRYNAQLLQEPSSADAAGDFGFRGFYFLDWYTEEVGLFGDIVDVLSPTRAEEFGRNGTLDIEVAFAPITYLKQRELDFTSPRSRIFVPTSDFGAGSITRYDVSFVDIRDGFNSAPVGSHAGFNTTVLDHTGSGGGTGWLSPNPMVRNGVVAELDVNLRGPDQVFRQADIQSGGLFSTVHPYKLVWKMNKRPTPYYPDGAPSIYQVNPGVGNFIEGQIIDVEIDGVIEATYTIGSGEDIDSFRLAMRAAIDGITGWSAPTNTGPFGFGIVLERDVIATTHEIFVYSGFGLQLKFSEETP